MHAADCYHRDIAPDNILMLPNGAPLLLDFGAARRVIGNMSHALDRDPERPAMRRWSNTAGCRK